MAIGWKTYHAAQTYHDDDLSHTWKMIFWDFQTRARPGKINENKSRKSLLYSTPSIAIVLPEPGARKWLKTDNMTKSIDINLEGTRDELIALFAYPKELQASNLSSLEEYIAHAFNQTLVRDGYTGAWAEVVVVKDSGQFVLKMYSPRHDLGRYQLIIPAFLEAGRLAVSIFAGIEKQVEEYGKGQMRFVLPFGLSMANTKSIQLLHFPPLEAFVYTDYLYSPTNRRWENLLAYNHFSKSPMTELETIVDCVPIAAPGGDSKGIEPFNNSFTPYVKQMLKARLRYAEHQNTPILGYGEPVMAWLKDAFPDVIKEVRQPSEQIPVLYG